MAGPAVLFVAAAGPSVGGGHVMRSLTLARALMARGAACAFLAAPEVAQILDAFAPDIAQRNVAGDFDGVVFDHYGLNRADHRAMAGGRPVLVIDDLADRPLGADIVIDSGPARSEADYRALTPAGTRLLLGPAYAPVRPEFARLRPSALARRSGPVRRLLVSLGLTDVGGATLRVLNALAPHVRADEMTIDVAVGGAAPSLEALQALAADKRIVLHVDTPAMAELTASADAGVGAAGSTTWERCTLGLPSILLVLADNQRAAAKALQERGAAIVVETFDSALDEALAVLLGDEKRRAALAAASAELCDGLGADRVAEAYLDLIAGR